jgi:hypothetical protein
MRHLHVLAAIEQDNDATISTNQRTLITDMHVRDTLGRQWYIIADTNVSLQQCALRIH